MWTKEEAVRIALERFEPLKKGRPEVPLQKLTKTWGGTRTTIGKAVRDAFHLGLVEVRATEEESQALVNPDRDRELELKMRRCYPQLFDAIVVRHKSNKSDFVHRDLGYAMARELGNHIAPKATIGVGSGRGPYYTVTGLNRLPRLPRDGITLMSLTGAVYAETHETRLNVLLDADFHTGLLGVSFSKPLKTQRMISYPIAPANVDLARSDTWLEEKEFDKHVPTVAIVGVGVLKGRHRFYEAVKKNAGGAALAPIFDDLCKLVTLTDKYSDEDHCPVADVCNRLYFIDSTRSSLAASDRRDFNELIAGINSRLLTISEPQLKKVGGLLLVAGTREKATAIRSLLGAAEPTEPQVRVRVLCTDAPTAELILR